MAIQYNVQSTSVAYTVKIVGWKKDGSPKLVRVYAV